MIASALHNHPRMLLLSVGMILVIGLSSYHVLPRMEDPVLRKRIGIVTTTLPGAGAERVESLVTAEVEATLEDIGEIKQLLSTSRSGVSNVVVELRDDVVDVEPVWSRVSDRLDDVVDRLPADAASPELERLPLKACAAIIAMRWEREDQVNFVILSRLAQELERSLRSIPGTEDVDEFGAPREEVVVEFDAETLAALGLSIGQVSQQLQTSDAKQPAGYLRTESADLALDVHTLTDSLASLGETPIRYGDEGRFAQLADIASISKTVAQPPRELAYVDSSAAIVLGVFVRDQDRIDHWSTAAREEIETFQKQLPPGITCEIVFSQSDYVEQRLDNLLRNLVIGTAAVVLVVFLLMGWRSTIIMSTALPLSALMVLIGLRVLRIPIHQMSVTGLIIALGLLIDNVIVMVDEIRSRIWAGMPASDAVRDGVRHLAMPLFGSTLTTTLAFAPIAMLPGPPGEFVGSIAVSVILAINSSFLLAMTLVPAMTALLCSRVSNASDRKTLVRYGFTSPLLTRAYEAALGGVLRHPWLGVLVAATLPICGFLVARDLPEQFFPPSDRSQIQVEIELAAGATLEQTEAIALSMREEILQDHAPERVHWFLGASAPTFYYNVVPRRRSAPFYGQAIVELRNDADAGRAVRRLQSELAARYPECRVLVRQLEQGPPFDAPIEVRLTGPDLATLQKLGSQLRLLLSESSTVIATRSDLEETLPKLAVKVDRAAARMARLDEGEIARQLYGSLEGLSGGTLLDGSEQLPIRVCLARQNRSLAELAAVALQSPMPQRPIVVRAQSRPPSIPDWSGPTLSAIAQLQLDSEVAVIPRLDGQRFDEVKAYLVASTLPSEAVMEFEQRLDEADFSLPAGYRMSYGGEAAKRNEAVHSLMVSGAVLFFLILVTLVVSFQSFRIALIIASVGGLSIGLGAGALACFSFPFGFMAIVGTMGLVGIAINDAIVVMAGIRSHRAARAGDPAAIRQVVVGCTRHVVATSLTTIVGFTPLVLDGGAFWPPLAITIAGGVGGATLLALFLVPSLYLLLRCHKAPRFDLTTPMGGVMD